MFKFSEGGIALFALISIAVWLLIGLPLIYSPEKSSAFWEWLTDDAAGFFALLAVGVAALQAWFFWYQLRLMRKSLNDASTAAQAALVSAEAAARQASVAEQSFAKLERPYVYVFGAKELKEEFEWEDQYEEKPTAWVNYHVANYGKTPATIEGCWLSISAGTEPEEPTQVAIWHQLVRRPILTPNEMREAITANVPREIETYLYADEDTPPGDLAVPNLKENERLFLWVKLKYRGPFSGEHETSACWVWDQMSVQFILHRAGPNYMT